MGRHRPPHPQAHHAAGSAAQTGRDHPALGRFVARTPWRSTGRFSDDFPAMPTTPPPTPKPPPLVRFLRSLVIIALVLALTLIAALSYLGGAFAAVETFFQGKQDAPDTLLTVLGII